jgi:pimeloyl-ACP methyl ester carboxylesterase
MLTFVGWSYGARLGAHYAHLFPHRVRALVLDGPPDPQAMRGSVVKSQIAGFEAAFLAYADRCSQRESCVPFGTVTASPVLVIATEADPSTPHSGGVAIARALGPSANLLTVSGGGRIAFGRSPCVVEHVTLYLVELRVPGGRAC